VDSTKAGLLFVLAISGASIRACYGFRTAPPLGGALGINLEYPVELMQFHLSPPEAVSGVLMKLLPTCYNSNPVLSRVVYCHVTRVKHE